MMASGLSPWLSALAWALLHFLWEGALIGLLAWAALALVRRRGPETRYALAYGALVLMVLAFLATFWLLAQNPGGPAVAVTVQDAAQGALDLPRWGWFAQGRKALEAALPALLALWCLGASVMLARLGSGYRWLHRTCLGEAQPAGAAWEACLDRLVRDLGLSRRVRLLVSSRLDTPLVLGAFRPLVLVPLAALAGLDPQALEAVLAHELAHVRRHDYLANLAQCFAEALLFYHPALRWLSRRIRLERELCCDDAAVRCCGDPLLYASALAGLEALRSASPHAIHLAPAAKGGPLMLRIRRILAAGSPAAPATSLATLSGAALALLLAAATFATACRSVPALVPPPAIQDVEFAQVKVAHQPDAPAYPAEAKAQRIQGTVVVQITMDSGGTPTGVKALSGPEELRPTAEAYAAQWKFQPVLNQGKPVPARFNLTMPFRLR